MIDQNIITALGPITDVDRLLLELLLYLTFAVGAIFTSVILVQVGKGFFGVLIALTKKGER